MNFEISAMLETLKSLFTESIATKVLFAIAAYIIADIFEPYQKLILISFIIYSIDFVTGVIKALRAKNFSSARFFRGALKIVVYGSCVVIAHGVDDVIAELLPFLQSSSYITLAMFAFIITTEASSVLENLHDLGFSTPAPFQHFLKSYSTKLRREKLMKIDPDSAVYTEDFCSDISDLVNVYIPKVDCPQLRKLLKIKFENRGIFCDMLQKMEIHDLDIFKSKIKMLAKETIKDIQTSRRKNGISEEIIERFETSHLKRTESFFLFIDNLQNKDKTNIESDKVAVMKELSLLNYQALTECLNLATN